MLTDDQINSLVREIHLISDTRGVPIGLYENDRCRLVDAGIAMTHPGGNTGVIIEAIEISQDLVAAPDPRPRRVETLPPDESNRSRLTSELLGAGLNCSLMAISAVGVVAGGAASVPTGGASLFAAVIAWTGLVTSTVQCTDSLIRSWEAASHPTSASLDYLDRDEAYSSTRRTVAVVGAASGLGATWVNMARASTIMAQTTISTREVLQLTAMAGDHVSLMSNIVSASEESPTTTSSLPRLIHGTSLIIHVFSYLGTATPLQPLDTTGGACLPGPSGI